MSYIFRDRVTVLVHATFCFESVTCRVWKGHVFYSQRLPCDPILHCYELLTQRSEPHCSKLIPFWGALTSFLIIWDLSEGNIFLCLWTQLWETGCTVLNAVCWHQFELCSAHFSIYLFYILANLSVGFLAVIFVKTIYLWWLAESGNECFS